MPYQIAQIDHIETYEKPSAKDGKLELSSVKNEVLYLNGIVPEELYADDFEMVYGRPFDPATDIKSAGHEETEYDQDDIRDFIEHEWEWDLDKAIEAIPLHLYGFYDFGLHSLGEDEASESTGKSGYFAFDSYEEAEIFLKSHTGEKPFLIDEEIKDGKLTRTTVSYSIIATYRGC